MKKNILNRLQTVLFLMTLTLTVQGQNMNAEVPGDNFSLEGALEVFKKSGTPQEFEQMINDPDSRVNNLDLNGDGYIDYIRVMDRNDRNVHVFVMQAVISNIEFQDIAVITLEKLANGKAVLQIIGDEDIYGVETIIEPTREVRTYGGTNTSRVVVNVWAWPSVQFIYGPHYTIWSSPWRWNYRPHWWYTRRPVVYYDYYAYWSPYSYYYTPCYTHRVVYYQEIYRPYRTTSVIVYNRHNAQISRYRSAHTETYKQQERNSNRTGIRQPNNTVRYDTNGRISSSRNQHVSSGSSVNSRTRQRTNTVSSRTQITSDNYTPNRTSSELRKGSNIIAERSSGLRSGKSSAKLNNSQSYSGSSQNTPRSSGRSDIQRSSGAVSGNSSVKQSYGSSSVQKSAVSSSVKRSSGNSSSSVQRSSRSSSSGANLRQSSGSSNRQRSTGNSNVQRSSGRSAENRKSR
jgi:hypothetical protein